MKLIVLDSHELPYALSAFTNIMSAKGPLIPREREFITTLCREYDAAIDLDALPSVMPIDVAAMIEDPVSRRWVVQMAVLAAMVSGEVTPSQHRAVKELDRALDVREPSLHLLRYLSEGNERMARLALLPRLYPRFYISAYRHGGLAYLRKTLGGFTNGYDDPAVAWRFRQLGLLPLGKVGRAFWEHFTRNRFKFPGEPGGLMSERMIFHDFGHILSGYATDAAGEIRQGAFQAGYARQDGFVFLLFILMQFHLGVRLTPVTKAQRGFFEPAGVLHALRRGAASQVDLSDCWNHWEAVELDIAEWRERCGVPPVEAVVDPVAVATA